mmetsp:Transcript_18471/g.24408  ORF Transcript_18471/g.24408 Transcript_18471/m.24408 type:complete len:284 (+) Transcript_18471:34-885(+)
MELEAYQRLAPESFYTKFISQKIRPDGRKLNDVRRVKIDIGVLPATAGSAIVLVGGTKVVAGVSLQVGQPADATPQAGDMIISCTLTPLCSPKVPLNKQPDEAAALEHYILQLLLRSKFLNYNDLCIVEGQSAWRLYVDVVCLNLEGNLLDAAVLAVVAALKNTKLPATKTLEDGEVQLTSDPLTPLKLGLVPFPLSFGIFQDQVISDPSLLEEGLVNARITVARNKDGQVCSVYKPGGCVLSGEKMNICLELCRIHISYLEGLLDATLGSKNETQQSQQSSI